MSEHSVSLRSMALEVDIDNAQFSLRLLDQTLLPTQELWIQVDTNEQMIEAIKSLRVRGAPLIGVAAALMVAKLAVQGEGAEQLLVSAKKLYEARPTAVNLITQIDIFTKNL